MQYCDLSDNEKKLHDSIENLYLKHTTIFPSMFVRVLGVLINKYKKKNR